MFGHFSTCMKGLNQICRFMIRWRKKIMKTLQNIYFMHSHHFISHLNVHCLKAFLKRLLLTPKNWSSSIINNHLIIDTRVLLERICLLISDKFLVVCCMCYISVTEYLFIVTVLIECFHWVDFLDKLEWTNYSDGIEFPYRILALRPHPRNVWCYITTFLYAFCFKFACSKMILLVRIQGNYPFSTYAKFSEKVTFITRWYAHLRIHIEGKKY